MNKDKDIFNAYPGVQAPDRRSDKEGNNQCY